MAKKGRSISFRLHPDNEYEAEAIEIYDALIAEGLDARKIFTDALLRLKGKKPEMFSDYTQQVTKPYLEALLADFAQHLIAEIGEVPRSGNSPEKDIPLTEDEDEAYARNLAAGYMARRKR